MIKQSLTIAALAAVLATPAFAQATKPIDNNATQKPMPSASVTQMGTFVQQQQATDWRSSKLVGTDVYGLDKSKIGSISDVLISSSGNVQAVVVGVGGFLGVGEKNVAIPFDALTIMRKPNGATIDKITVTYSKDDLNNAPKFAWYQSSETTGANTGTTNTSPMHNTAPMKK
jgi:sporulation protein YlmC with PRC-barrel domain